MKIKEFITSNVGCICCLNYCNNETGLPGNDAIVTFVLLKTMSEQISFGYNLIT